MRVVTSPSCCRSTLIICDGEHRRHTEHPVHYASLCFHYVFQVSWFVGVLHKVQLDGDARTLQMLLAIVAENAGYPEAIVKGVLSEACVKTPCHLKDVVAWLFGGPSNACSSGEAKLRTGGWSCLHLSWERGLGQRCEAEVERFMVRRREPGIFLCGEKSKQNCLVRMQPGARNLASAAALRHLKEEVVKRQKAQNLPQRSLP